MSVAVPPIASPISAPYAMRRFTVDEYHRMIASGILTEDDPVELLEGWIVEKMPRNPTHNGTIELANQVLERRLPPGWKIRIQSAITTADSEPEPDVVVVRGSTLDHFGHHPLPEEIGLLIEVADSSLARDRDKARVYARAAIICYWIINLVDRQIEVYTAPSGPGDNPAYRGRDEYRSGDSIPLVIDGHEVDRIEVSSLLPD
jgi:Uma2 family endonuclease